jgi:hypothetical protein
VRRFAHSLRRFERDRRFWRLVDVDGPRGCWRWRGPVDAGGEPTYRDRPARLHAYELACGPLHDGTQLERHCADQRCVNPDHMSPTNG